MNPGVEQLQEVEKLISPKLRFLIIREHSLSCKMLVKFCFIKCESILQHLTMHKGITSQILVFNVANWLNIYLLRNKLRVLF